VELKPIVQFPFSKKAVSLRKQGLPRRGVLITPASGLELSGQCSHAAGTVSTSAQALAFMVNRGPGQKSPCAMPVVMTGWSAARRSVMIHALSRASIVILVLSRREIGHPALAALADASNFAWSPPGMRAFTSR
jgi:hypothetical protein